MTTTADRRLPLAGVPPVERFWYFVGRGPHTVCWQWTGALSDGYGRIRVGKGRVKAHRFAYELLVGPIPTGLVIDHLCRNRSCVNPAHMEPVTNKENALRGEGLQAKNAKRTHCHRGHPFQGTNFRLESAGRRRCRLCHRINWLNRYHRRKGVPT